MSTRRGRPRPLVAAAGLIVALALGWPVPGGAAEGEPGSGRYLHVTTDPDPAEFPNLGPGDTVVWHLDVRADPPDIGIIARSLTATGALAEVPGALTVSVWSCDRPYHRGPCPGTERQLLAPTPLPDLVDVEADLGEQSTDVAAWLAVHVAVSPQAGEDAQGKSATLVIGASGESADAPPGPLPRTGTDLATALALALTATATGLGLSATARRRLRTSLPDSPATVGVPSPIPLLAAGSPPPAAGPPTPGATR